MISDSSVKILLIEDNLAEARLLQEFLKQAHNNEFNLVHVKRLQEALDTIGNDISIPCIYDAILLDLTLPDSQGLASLQPLMSRAPCLPIVVLTNTNDEQLAIEAVRRGAQDYLVKRQVNAQILIRALRYAIERKQTLETLRALNQSLKNRIEERTTELLKAKEINQFKSEFVSILSHDIRNPLNTILLAAGLLKNSDQKLTPEKKVAHYQMIRSAIKNMSLLLDEASFIGKADAGKMNCNFDILNLLGLCQELIAELKLSINQKNLTIIFTTEGFICDVFADENLLRHILSNLLNNAIKYSLPTNQIIFKLIYQEKLVIFQIQDFGIGISESEHEQIFQPFYRAANVGTIAGTGLGLAIVKKCVEAHGGEISVQSQIGLGTIFTVSLPLISETEIY